MEEPDGTTIRFSGVPGMLGKIQVRLASLGFGFRYSLAITIASRHCSVHNELANVALP